MSPQREEEEGICVEGGREKGVDNNQKVQLVVLSKLGKEGGREGGRDSWRESSVFPFPFGLSTSILFMVSKINNREECLCVSCLIRVFF